MLILVEVCSQWFKRTLDQLSCFRQYNIALCVILLSHCQVASAWLGERTADDAATSSAIGTSEIDPEESQQALDVADQDFWIVPNELVERRDQYRNELRKYWPDSLETVRKNGFTYYRDNFSTSVSVLFVANQIEIIVPRQRNKLHLYDQLAERRAVQGHLQNLLSMTKRELLQSLASELMINEDNLNGSGDLGALVLQELFSGSVTPHDIERLTQDILGTARIRVFDQESLSSIAPVPREHVQFVMDMPDERINRAAKIYYPLVAQYSQEFDVPESLVLAVIHTESHFNPLALSPIPAYGLMQIVPWTAGKDAVGALYGENHPDLSPEYLFDARNNIKIGAAYLHILYYRYLKDIESEKSRAYTAIAAYNTGPSNIARAFVNLPRMSEAIPVINGMSEPEVLNRMLNYAPSLETREYLAKVVAREHHYERLVRHWE